MHFCDGGAWNLVLDLPIVSDWSRLAADELKDSEALE